MTILHRTENRPTRSEYRFVWYDGVQPSRRFCLCRHCLVYYRYQFQVSSFGIGSLNLTEYLISTDKSLYLFPEWSHRTKSTCYRIVDRATINVQRETDATWTGCLGQGGVRALYYLYCERWCRILEWHFSATRFILITIMIKFIALVLQLF